MANKLLMIKTKDKRNLFTARKNLPSLIEYAKTFNAELSEVETDVEPLDITQLVKCLCDASYSQDGEIYNSTLLLPTSKAKKPRSLVLKDASLVKQWIESQFLTKKVVSLKGVKDKFADLELSDATLNNYIYSVRKKLKTQGHMIAKSPCGGHCLVNFRSDESHGTSTQSITIEYQF